MNYSLSNMLGGGFVGGLDPSAKAYIDAVVAAGATVTGAQKTAINNFIKAEKDASRYTLIKRLYLPIWGISAANAIDLKTLASGTFVGGTHASGYVGLNGLTQYFRTGAIPSSLLAGVTDVTIGFLCYIAASAGTRAHIGSQVSASQSLSTLSTTTALRFDCGNNSAASATLAVASQTGIIMQTSFSGRFRQERRSSAGFTTVQDIAGTASGTLPNIELYGGARNLSGAVFLLSDGGYSSWFLANGFTSTQTTNFSTNLKTLWETCTGLTLP